MKLPTTGIPGTGDTLNPTSFVYSDDLAQHVLRQGHPLNPTRLRYTHQLLDAFQAFGSTDSRLIQPNPATDEQVLTFHTGEYLAAVRALSQGVAVPNQERYGLSLAGDNPIHRGMHEAALLSTGATLLGAELVMNQTVRVAFSPSGGLHHAMPGRASGFCLYNDPVVAIKAMVARGLKVAYVDIDVHHGDGVQYAFYDTDQVLTLSLHESGRFLFPGTGFIEEIGTGKGRGYSVNVPLAPLTDDEIYGWAFQEVVPPLLKAFNPDILVTQLGIDTYYSDPLAHLGLTSGGYEAVLRAFAEQSRTTPWLALGGGGYDLSAVARCWTLAYGVMAGRDWPDTIPAEQQEQLGTSHLRDRQPPSAQRENLEPARGFARDSVRQVQDLIFPYYNL